MRRPSKAVVLAAGFGARLSPLTRSIPKALLPLMGTPLLLRNLRMLESWGVREVVVNLHHGADKVFSAARRWQFASLRLCFSFEPQLLETGGALARARWFAGRDPFWLLNADIAVELDPRLLLGSWRPGDLAAVWLVRGKGPMTVTTRRGIVKAFRGGIHGSPGTGTLSGVHLLHPRILSHIRGERPFSIVAAYESAIAAGERVRAVFSTGAFWADLGTPDAYIDAHGDMMRAVAGKRACFVSISPGARVAPSAALKDSVILQDAVVHAGARLDRAAVAPSAHVYGTASGLVVGAADLPAPFPALAAGIGWPVGRTMAVPFPARPSDRQFVRFRFGRRSAVAVVHHGQRPENNLYVKHARFLRSIGIHVPRVLLDRPALNAAVLEDAGDRTLELAARASTRARRLGLYRMVLESAARLHSDGRKAALARRIELVAPFSPELYGWEHGLFMDRFLAPRLAVSPAMRRAILGELRAASRVLLEEPPVLVHRDLQSSNVHVRRGAIVFIDFQGMRFGAALYDVASLLCDPYAMLAPDEQRILLENYCALSGLDPEEAAGVFPCAGVQRLAQALGAYGRMCESRDTSRFARYIKPGLAMLDRMVAQTRGMPALEEAVKALAAPDRATEGKRGAS